MSPDPIRPLRRLWRGELPLAEAFWLWAVLGAIGYALAAWIAGYALSIPYNILALVGVWRSADRYQERGEGEDIWAHAARSLALVGLVAISLF